jgi:hypothetical protein
MNGAMAAPLRRARVGFALALVLGACGRSGLGDADDPRAPSTADAGAPATAPAEDASPPATADADDVPDASVDPPATEDADSARVCPVDAGGTVLDPSGCAAREVVPCVPFTGETVQETLDNQIFGGSCQHREGAGGFTVRFDAERCPVEVSGGFFSACDVAWLSTRRFACALGHPCATAPTLVK